MIRKFESFDGEKDRNVRGWKDDLLMVYDYFAELSDSEVIYSIDYQAGTRSSSGTEMIVCYLSDDEKIEGRTDQIDHFLSVNSKILIRVMIKVSFKNGNFSPFGYSGSVSYFGENADIFLEISSKLNLIKNRVSSKYKIGITMKSDWFYINFLEK